MSTRATYTVTDIRFDVPSMDFYIHYDGYAEGAASYIHQMLIALGEGRGGAITAFIRGNKLAEITPRASRHSDREYHYDISIENGKVMVVAFATEYVDNDSQLAETFFSGSAIEFLSKYGDGLELFEYCQNGLTEYLSLEGLTSKLEKAKQRIEHFKGNLENPNVQREFDKIIELSRLMPPSS